MRQNAETVFESTAAELLTKRNFFTDNQEQSMRAWVRLSEIPFSDFWAEFFEWAEKNFPEDPLKEMKRRIACRSQEVHGDELRDFIAETMMEDAGDKMLKGAIIGSPHKEEELDEEVLTGLARLLFLLREKLEEEKVVDPGWKAWSPRPISSDWIHFAKDLDEESPDTTQRIQDEIKEALEQENPRHAIEVAKVLARHFPEMVLSGLENAPEYRMGRIRLFERRDRIEETLTSETEQ